MIFVFGSINLDLVTRVARLPKAGETVIGESYSLHPGGKGANQALAARLAGARVALAGAVGRDGFADLALERLARAGVDLSAIAREEAPTGIAMIGVDPAGENQILVASGANLRARAAALGNVALSDADTLLMQLELPLREVVEAAALAKGREARVIINAAPFASLSAALLKYIDILVLNEGEASSLAADQAVTAQSEREKVLALNRRLGCAVVVTRGGEGVLASRDGALVSVPGRSVKVVDTTGAGDTFCGVLAAGLDAGRALERALEEANAAAGLACTREGAQPSFPTRAEIDRSLAEVPA